MPDPQFVAAVGHQTDACSLLRFGASVCFTACRKPDRLQRAVDAYIVVISGMVVLAAGTALFRPGYEIVVAAVSFYLSDLSVARDRFLNAGFGNRLWGLPLYYAAQHVFVASLSA